MHFEVELQSLDQLETFHQRGAGSQDQTEDWMRAFSEILMISASDGDHEDHRITLTARRIRRVGRMRRVR